MSHFLSTFFKHPDSHVPSPSPPTQGNFSNSQGVTGDRLKLGCCQLVPHLANLTACLGLIFITHHSKQAQIGGF